MLFLASKVSDDLLRSRNDWKRNQYLEWGDTTEKKKKKPTNLYMTLGLDS